MQSLLQFCIILRFTGNLHQFLERNFTWVRDEAKWSNVIYIICDAMLTGMPVLVSVSVPVFAITVVDIINNNNNKMIKWEQQASAREKLHSTAVSFVSVTNKICAHIIARLLRSFVRYECTNTCHRVAAGRLFALHGRRFCSRTPHTHTHTHSRPSFGQIQSHRTTKPFAGHDERKSSDAQCAMHTHTHPTI